MLRLKTPRVIRFLNFPVLLVGVVLLLAQSRPGNAQTREPLASSMQPELDSVFTRLLVQGTYSLQVNNQRFSGPGWDRLQQDINASQFVLIGEDHGIAQVPLLTAAIAQAFKPKLYVAEIDPYTAQTLTNLLKTPGLPIAHQRRYFQGLSFYSWTEEYRLLEALQVQQTQLVGIEQINYGFAGQLFTAMAQGATQAATVAYLHQQAKSYQAQFEACMRQHTYLKPTQSAMDSLLMMTSHEPVQVQKMARDFVSSYQIYEASARRMGGHQKRINLMKRNLFETLRPYLATADEPLPTMLFKFGANHLARNLSIWSSVFDVGNLVVNLADAQSKKSLHLMVMGKHGTKAGYTDIDNPDKDVVVPYSATDSPFLAPFFAQTKTQWQVFDLRPLRRAIITDKLQIMNQELEATILGYDYLIVIPETTASRAF